MNYWIKLKDWTSVSYRVEDPAASTYFDSTNRMWYPATEEMIEEARTKLLADGYALIPPPPLPEEEKPKKPKRKELMRRIEELEKDQIARNDKYEELVKLYQDMKHRAEFCSKCEFVTHDKQLFDKHLITEHGIMRFEGIASPNQEWHFPAR
jgi:hypothetical protein